MTAFTTHAIALASARTSLRSVTSVVTDRDGRRTEQRLADGSEEVVATLPPVAVEQQAEQKSADMYSDLTLPQAEPESTRTGSTPTTPPPISAAARSLVDEPTRAWQIISAKQQARPLPLERFTRPPAQAPGTVRFVCISDTHSAEARGRPLPALPDGDVLLHAGDFTQTGRLEEIASFCKWFGSLPHKRKIVIAGNHDLSLHGASYGDTSRRFGHPASTEPAEASAQARAMLSAIPNCEYLCDSGTSVRGVRVWGSPWQPWFHDWAFNLPRGDACRRKWELIPAGTDVVMTHGPALGHGDLCSSGMRAGCLDLLDELQQRIRPAYHVFGHIHEGYGATTDGRTTYVNASTCTLRYRPDHAPLVFDVPARESQAEALAADMEAAELEALAVREFMKLHATPRDEQHGSDGEETAAALAEAAAARAMRRKGGGHELC